MGLDRAGSIINRYMHGLCERFVSLIMMKAYSDKNYQDFISIHAVLHVYFKYLQ